MVIVGGSFEMAAGERDQFLADRHELMRASRIEAGCLEYTFCADPIDPRRVVLFERWTDQESLDAHLAALRAGPPPSATGVVPVSSSIIIYGVSGERRLV